MLNINLFLSRVEQSAFIGTLAYHSHFSAKTVARLVVCGGVIAGIAALSAFPNVMGLLSLVIFSSSIYWPKKERRYIRLLSEYGNDIAQSQADANGLRHDLDKVFSNLNHNSSLSVLEKETHEAIARHFRLSFMVQNPSVAMRQLPAGLFVTSNEFPSVRTGSVTGDSVAGEVYHYIGKHNAIPFRIFILESGAIVNETTSENNHFGKMTLVFEHGHHYHSTTFLTSKSSVKIAPYGLERAVLESDVFEEKIDVFTADQIEARSILTPHVMVEIIRLVERISERLEIHIGETEVICSVHYYKWDRVKTVSSMFASSSVTYQQYAYAIIGTLFSLLSLIDIFKAESEYSPTSSTVIER